MGAARHLIALMMLPLAFPVRADADSDGDALAGRFLDHVRSIAPVAGSFTVEIQFDAELERASRAERKKWAEARGKSLAFGPEAPVLRSEWAWDGTREALKSLEGSNTFEQFYRTPEALLRAMAPDNYNLDTPQHPPTWRPASFYLLVGAAPWSDYLKDHEFTVRDAPAGSPPASRLLIARSGGGECRLVVDEATGELHGHETDLADGPYARLSIDRVERSTDGRPFPSRARLTVFLRGKPHQFITLTSQRITFDRADVAEATKMALPEGAVVHDRFLNRVLPIRRRTDVEDLLSDRVAAEAPEAPSLPPPLPTPTQATLSRPDESSAGRWAWIAGTVLLLAVGIGATFRGLRLWDRQRAGPSAGT